MVGSFGPALIFHGTGDMPVAYWDVVEGIGATRGHLPPLASKLLYFQALAAISIALSSRCPFYLMFIQELAGPDSI